MAHFIEHCLFKGTARRKSYHVLSRLEDVGGDLNAFTSKEDITIHASFMGTYLSRAMELLFDVAFNSVYPARELEKEKEVIVDEINSYREIPSEMIFEEIESLVFPSHPLGRPILGDEESLRRFTRRDILRFIRRCFSPERIVLCVSGNHTAEKIRRIAEKYIEPYREGLEKRRYCPLERRYPEKYVPVRVEKPKDASHQTHIIVAGRAPSWSGEEKTTMALLNNLLGGPSMSSRLNMELRERSALVYSVESFYTPYCDTGIAGVYLGTDHDTAARSLDLLFRELKKIREVPLGTLQLSRAKRQMIGQIAIGRENNLNLMLSRGRSVLCREEVKTLGQIRQEIEKISARQIMEMAGRVFDPEKLTTLIYKGASSD